MLRCIGQDSLSVASSIDMCLRHSYLVTLLAALLMPALSAHATASRHLWQGITALSVSPDGSAIASAGADGTMRLWAMASFQELLHFSGQKNMPATGVDFSTGGMRAASAGRD